MIEISLCMIVKNEEDCLDNCLRSVHDLMDEIIIVDTGSTDRTKEIAARYTDKIYDFTWIDDFAAARNFSFSKATKEYCMWLDADDILTEENRDKLLELKSSLNPEIDVVITHYHSLFTEDGRLARTHTRERIVKRSRNYQWEDPVHETINCTSGLWLTSDIAITHKKNHAGSDRNFRILETAMKNENPHWKTRYYYASELTARSRWDEAIEQFELFFSEGGFETLDCLDACMCLHDLYIEKKQYEKALKISMDCLPHCLDRSEFCCQLGCFYALIIQDLNEAIYWFDAAVKCPYPDILGFTVRQEYYYYMPNLQLGNAYCMQGRYEEGLACFQKALQYYPESVEARQWMRLAYTKLLESREKKD